MAHRRPRATAAQQQFRAAGVAYLPAFLPPDDFRAVQRECTALRRCLKKENNTVAKKRLGTYIAEESAIYGIFAGPQVHGRLGKVLEGDYWVSEFPMEYRVYPVGSSMDWHLDECLYEEPQYELVYTVTNTSDALTEWREGGLRVGEWTEPNSLLIVRAESALHRVTPRTGTARYSLPYFFNPTYETDYAPLPGSVVAGDVPHYRTINWGDFRQARADGDFADYGTEVQISQFRTGV